VIPVLALDPSTKFGWALKRLVDGEQRIDYGSWKLGEGLLPGAYFLRAMNQVTALRKRFGIDGEPLQIVIEDTSLNATGTRDTKHIAESWLGIFEAYAEMRGWPRPIAVPVNSWRAAFIGRQWAPKEVEGEKERRKWIKDATIQECKRRGLNPPDDNAADATGILFWYLVGGPIVQEQRRNDRRARTKAKRAQLKMFGKAA
jgi:hypothetical protein